MHEVAVLALDGVVALEVAMPGQILGSAQSADGAPLYRVRVCGPGEGVTASAAGSGQFQLRPPHPVTELLTADTVVVPAHETDDRVPETVLDLLRRAHASGVRLASICTGAAILAQTGLLDGRRATTHWRHADALARRYPAVRFDPAAIFIDDGDILTGAGTTAGVDLCLHMVRRDFGAAVAAQTGRRVVAAPWRDGGQAQFVARQEIGDEIGELSGTMHWLLERLAEPVTLDRIAARARVSTRTLSRRFLAHTGVTPVQWLIEQRVFAARDMLESGGSGVEEIARACGFGSATALRQHFRRRLGTTPTAYRARFRAG
ncbi:transcriptional regulator, AraC family with amidase-like domain [Stackebrandtia albiflava]|uniref:Transcriptional regulator, AraC family with amidase-like domain n=1 Tax=Stackebrandtia albiflava TaxID=406432 RepID=A0A562UPM0_9ACTN|nr:helix-turn-helix domain-containing protein [Stackebrandtia albiflava]TWJ07559.1 transcriptional regulator, AraC family with amidase-like domain [Stackebrandtia albiflava]